MITPVDCNQNRLVPIGTSVDDCITIGDNDLEISASQDAVFGTQLS